MFIWQRLLSKPMGELQTFMASLFGTHEKVEHFYSLVVALEYRIEGARGFCTIHNNGTKSSGIILRM